MGGRENMADKLLTLWLRSKREWGSTLGSTVPEEASLNSLRTSHYVSLSKNVTISWWTKTLTHQPLEHIQCSNFSSYLSHSVLTCPLSQYPIRIQKQSNAINLRHDSNFPRIGGLQEVPWMLFPAAFIIHLFNRCILSVHFIRCLSMLK